MKKSSLLTSIALGSLVSLNGCTNSPFSAEPMKEGYENNSSAQASASDNQPKQADGACSANMDKSAEGKCGEGKCGAQSKQGDGACSAHMDMGKSSEGKCGEGKCGAGQ